MDWEIKAAFIFFVLVPTIGVLFEQYQRRMMNIGYIFFKPKSKTETKGGK